MKQQKWIVGPAAIALALGTVGIGAVKAANTGTGLNGTRLAAKGGKKKGNKGGKKAANNPATREITMIEQAIGKPLTDEQKQGVLDAYKSYHESVAKSVGLTPDELDAKEKEYRLAHRGERRGGAAVAPPAVAPVTPPATTPPA